jgi:hypothetical protein
MSLELSLASESKMPIGSLTIVLIAVAILGAVWGQARIRARRRWKLAIDTFARLQMSHESPTQFSRSAQITLAEPAFRSREPQTVTG